MKIEGLLPVCIDSKHTYTPASFWESRTLIVSLIYKDENFRLILYCSDDLFSRLGFLICLKKRGKNLYQANFEMLS